MIVLFFESLIRPRFFFFFRNPTTNLQPGTNIKQSTVGPGPGPPNRKHLRWGLHGGVSRAHPGLGAAGGATTNSAFQMLTAETVFQELSKVHPCYVHIAVYSW